ncbi:MAG: hypothetical protein A3C22_03565 [Candidatus Levybacteria bacterium RIFCSPHIGHO2_02_FULL_37_10]|nr:MAG: hypothetical protein A3C22_03565 [Candidatus Levybacteria bacterium RIFCSPHIGHO2_02_FULL_37_10]
MFKIIQKYKHEFVLAILVLLYISYFTLASFLRYDNFYTGRFDLGNMDQTVWNTINGRIFQASDDNGEIVSRLSAHADFILILLSPFYLLWSHPKTLLLIQTIVLALGAVFVYLIAEKILKNKSSTDSVLDKNFALLFGFLFLMYPALQFTNLYDFHGVTIATTTLLASFYFLIKRSYFLMIVFLILSGITKEQVWTITFFFGIPLLFQKAKRVKFLGTIIIVTSLALFYYLVAVAIPQNTNGQHFALSYYSDFGDTPTQVVKNIFLSPSKLISAIFEASRIGYLNQLFMPFGFMSLLSPLALFFAIPDLLIGLLSNNSHLRQIYYQYTATITPFILISAIFAVKNFSKWFSKIPKYCIAIYLLFLTLFSAYSFGPLPWAKRANTDMFTKPQSNREIIEDFLSKIPEKYTIAATNNLGSHLSQREVIYTIPIGIDKADIVLFLLNDRFAQPSLGAQRQMVEKLKQDKNYIKVFEKDNFVVFKKPGVLL